MIIDDRTEFADNVSVAAAAGTALIGDVYDLGIIGREVGDGQPLYFVITVDTSVVTGGLAGTVQFKFVSDDTAAIATNGTASEHVVTKAFVTDDVGQELTTGAILVYPLTMQTVETFERFVGVLAVTATTTTTAGAISAFLTLDPPNVKKFYADASN
ncbi:MAG: hypothetical protein MN733_16105 [Nitrososphaera sp.]|nr:hypothetical protein [Nitrososphaera sp.]